MRANNVTPFCVNKEFKSPKELIIFAEINNLSIYHHCDLEFLNSCLNLQDFSS